MLLILCEFMEEALSSVRDESIYLWLYSRFCSFDQQRQKPVGCWKVLLPSTGLSQAVCAETCNQRRLCGMENVLSQQRPLLPNALCLAQGVRFPLVQ